MIKSPCLGCGERKIKCHSVCEKYIAYKKECEIVAENRRKELMKRERTTGIPKYKKRNNKK